MKSTSVGIVALATLCGGCVSNNLPSANLSFSKFEHVDNSYLIEFYSDQNIEGLLIANGKKAIVSRWLTCALENDVDLRVEHTIEKTYTGRFSQTGVEGERKFKYAAIGYFYHSPSQGLSRVILEPKDVISLLGNRKEVDCKASVTVYFSKPYYSQVMKVPVVHLVKVLKDVPPRPVCCKK